MPFTKISAQVLSSYERVNTHLFHDHGRDRASPISRGPLERRVVATARDAVSILPESNDQDRERSASPCASFKGG